MSSQPSGKSITSTESFAARAQRSEARRVALWLGVLVVMLLLTDGFFEWARPGDGEQFGVPRLCQTLTQCAESDAPTILRAMDEAVRGFAGASSQPDDMTAIVVKRRSTR